MQFDVLMIDPPWAFNNVKTGGSHTSGASQKYETMTLPELAALAVPAVCHRATVLFLWVPTALKFTHGAVLAHAWGFQRYITTIYWVKERNGMGFWFRNRVEELLVFEREPGAVEPFRCQRPNVIQIPAGEHSEKPEEFRRLIEDATKQFSRRHCLELFARRQAVGWTCCGLGVTHRDIRTDLRMLAERPELGVWP
jgi:N6-adenosine-specific RNA methylase IME4